MSGITLAHTAIDPANATGNLRARLYQTLAPCLPGRVYAYAPNAPGYALAPALWIGGHSAPSARPLFVVTFSVWGIADGAAHTAQAMIDELTASVIAATFDAVSPFNLEGWTTTTFDVDVDQSIPAVQFDVSATLTAVTFCPPIPYEALVPPEVIT